ncbi:MAG: AraC family transcriptional regulator [Lachnospiraceae bacterium]|nr:AraC family transcriptional regulator [Lachnospiraceae bacterium]
MIKEEACYRAGSGECSCHHRWMMIGRCRNGNRCIRVGSDLIMYRSGMYFIIPASFTYSVIPDEDSDSNWDYVLVNENAAGNLFSSRNRKLYEELVRKMAGHLQLFNYPDKPEMGLMIRLLLAELEGKNVMYQENSQGILQVLMVYVFRDFYQTSEISEEKRRMDGFDYILPSIQYINDHFQELIRISTLARICHVSESYYRQLFFEYMHQSPLEYMNRFRIEKACNLIVNTSYSMEMIAVKCGFQALSTFYRNFRNLKGCTPCQWRNNKNHGCSCNNQH